jgi:uncharacterized protein (DUF1015 family)
MDIRPFRGWRYRPADGDVSKLIAPPYDILSADDKSALLAGSPRNIVAVDMPHVPPKEVGPESAYQGAAATLAGWQAQGALAQDEQPAVYAYCQTFMWAGRTYKRRALLCGVRGTELGKDVIPHEHTFAGPKADRLKLMQHTRLQLSPIFGFCEGAAAPTDVWKLTERPADLHGVMRGVEEQLWAISDAAAIEQLRKRLAQVPVYIADGHHRYTTALNYRDWLAASSGGKLPPEHPANFVLFALVDRGDSGLLILPTHRIFTGLRPDFSVGKLAAAATDFNWQRVSIEGADLSNADSFLSRHGKTAMAFIGANPSEIWIATLKDSAAMYNAAPKELPEWRELDVAILHTLIVDKALAGLADGKPTVEYTPDGLAVMAACKSSRAQLGVCLQSTPLSAVEAVARVGGYMPHKSTYFYPKLATGMVLKPLE